ncbi:MAG: DUF2169 domain-containing protein [Desulfohalobiaceae bacterium]|nr:DUF2169 domain-containing protein [Desulfohalobiaceae bacterium]
MHIVQPYRPLQVGFNSRVLEQNRRFFFTVSATLGVDLQTGEALLDVDFLKDAFESMGDNPTPELGMPKPCGEFLLTGTYFAPQGEAVGGGEVKVRLGAREKSLYVFGPRRWGKRGLSTPPEPIDSLPLDYFRAFGGKGYEPNPDGIGYLDGQLPCIEDPGSLVTSPRDTPEPAGLGPLPLDCPQRMRFRGTYDDDYKWKYYPGHPEDFDWRFFLNTAEDQWISGFFRGDEAFAVFNMHPELQRIEGALPGLYARCFLRQKRDDGSFGFGELPLNLDTVWFFPDKVLALLVFRGVMEVGDDEAEQVGQVLLAYEDRRDEPRSEAYYQNALEKRLSNENPFSNYFQTQDLIPTGAKCALEIFQEKGEVSLEESPLSQNIQARADQAQEEIDGKVDQALQDVEEQMKEANVPGDIKASVTGGDTFDLQKIVKDKPETGSDPEVDVFTQKLEEIMPGITSGRGGKVDLKDFPFDRIGEIAGAAEEMGREKENQAWDRLQKELAEPRERIQEQIAGFKEAQSDDQQVQDKLKELEEQLDALERLDKGEQQKMPLPRLKAGEILEKIPRQLPPDLLETMQHVQGLKSMGVEDQSLQDLEQQVAEQLDTAVNEIEDPLYQLEERFKEGYRLSAHFMDEGESPHNEPLEEVRARFLQALAGGDTLAGGDWACIDLSGQNLDGIDLSGAFLEQVNFDGASLREAKLARAILARADLSAADLTGADLEEANIGGVTAVKTVFSGASLKGTRLSRGDFREADFRGAILEDVETMSISIDKADFTRAAMPGTRFIQADIRGACFAGTDLSTSFFLESRIEDTDFSGAVMNRCLFANTCLTRVCFDGAEFCESCFAGTEAEKCLMEGLSFCRAVLRKSNFQRMVMRDAAFREADLENAFLESADLSGADFSRARAKCAQFRKADLTGAGLEGIDLAQGSLAKARLVNVSLKGANLYQVDFLRSTITDSDFSGSNLEATLIENWRPE